jgi:hypothetical protein
LEIASSRWMGVVALERWGRQPTLTAIVLALTLMHAMTAWQPSIATVCATKFADLVAIGYFALSVQTILSDLVAMDCDAADTLRDGGTPASRRDRSSRMSAAIGTQMALSGVGFLTGMLCAGELASRARTSGSSGDGLALVYGTSALVGAVAVLLIRLGLPETSISRLQQLSTTLTPAVQSANPKKKTQWWQFLVSCTGLLTRHGNDVRILGVLLMLMTFPMFMGDMFQIYAKSEWNLSSKQLSSFFALFGGINVLSHAVGGVLVRRMGIRHFTILAVASKLMTAVGTACFGYHGSVIGLLLGFLGAAQTLGIVAALVAAGTATGLPQGELAGERAALLALLKVVGPILYSALLVQGEQWWGTKRCPLFFNIGLSVVALLVSWVHLRD